MAQRFAEKTTKEWVAFLEPRGVLCTQINTYAEAAENPQLQANKTVVAIDHPKAGRLSVLGTPIRLYGTPATRRRPPPELGEHTVEVLRELGYAAEQITSLQETSALGWGGRRAAQTSPASVSSASRGRFRPGPAESGNLKRLKIPSI
jgi:crotonobetainyl-CoA:carnitine CoA-transferase CaiB-like acyl-CoA transferase